MLTLLLLAGCKRGNDAAPDAVSPAAPTDDAAETSEADALAARAAPPEFDPRVVTDTTPVDTQVVDVQLADGGDNERLTGRRTTTFDRTDPVFMAIRTQGTAAKYTLSAKWLDPAGGTLAEYGQDVRQPGPAETLMSLSRPDGWTPGAYRVELAINGRAARTVEFTVR
jgi:hypothetical protein